MTNKVRVGSYKTPTTVREWHRHRRGKQDHRDIEWGPWQDADALTADEIQAMSGGDLNLEQWKREPEPYSDHSYGFGYTRDAATVSRYPAQTFVGGGITGYAPITPFKDGQGFQCAFCGNNHLGKTPATHWYEEHKDDAQETLQILRNGMPLSTDMKDISEYPDGALD